MLKVTLEEEPPFPVRGKYGIVCKDKNAARSPRTTRVCFCVVTVNNKHTNLRSKGSVGVKHKDDISAELCLKLSFESDWYFCNITESGWL